MNENHLRTLHPSTRRLRAGFDPAAVSLDCNDASDTLFIYLFEGSDPLVSVPVGDGYISLLVDPDSEEVIGFQLDDFLDSVVLEQPSWLDIASLADISPQKIDEARTRSGDARWRDAVLASTIHDLVRESELFTT